MERSANCWSSDKSTGRETEPDLSTAASVTGCAACQVSHKSQPPTLLQEKNNWHYLEGMNNRVDEMCEMLRGVDALLRENEARRHQQHTDFFQWTTEQAAWQERRWQEFLKKAMVAHDPLKQGANKEMKTEPIRRGSTRDSLGGSASPSQSQQSKEKQDTSALAESTTKDSLSATAKGDSPEVDPKASPASLSSSDKLARKASQMKRGLSDVVFLSSARMKRAKSEQSFLRNIVSGGAFGGASGMAIVLNAVCIGVSTEWSAARGGAQPPSAFRVFDVLFCIFFALELAVRVSAEGRHFLIAREWRWNVFDIIVVTISIVEEIVMLSTDDSKIGNLTFLRVLRLLRLVRVLRIVRVISFFRELRLLVYSVMGSLRSLMWTILLILIMLYVFGVFLTQFVTDHLSEARKLQQHDSEIAWEAELIETYGTLFRSIYSLYKGMTGGMDWGDGATPLIEGISPWFAVLYSLYIAFALFAMLNVVTGIFVEHAMKDAQSDADFMIQETLADKQSKSQEMEKLFIEADTSGDGVLTMKELEDHFEDERVAAYLEAMELDVSQTRNLFHLIDVDGSGTVGIDEFLEGCRKLKGTVSSLDFALMQIDFKRSMKHVSDQMGHLTRQVLDNAQLRGDDGEAPPAPPAPPAPAIPLAGGFASNRHSADATNAATIGGSVLGRNDNRNVTPNKQSPDQA